MFVHRLIILLAVFLITLPAFSQSEQEKLSEKRKKLESEIAYTAKLLKETRSSQNSTLNELKLINVKINSRSDLVATLKSEVYYLNNNIESTEKSVARLENELLELKEKYIEIAWHAYKYRSSYSKLIFLFSADGINQAYQRMRYLDQLSSYIRKEAEIIKAKEAEKSGLLSELIAERTKKNQLLQSEQNEMLALEQEQTQKERLKKELEKRESQLRKSKRDKEKQTRALDRQIQKIILAETKPKKDTKTGNTYELTPSEKKLSSSFASNKGKLPWPTERGVVASTFGVHKHPVLKKVRTKNNGIDIATTKNSEARAVFEGKVVSITKISNTNLAVIIKHGSYFTVYSNLEEAYVKRGDEVDTKEVIGKIHTNLKGETELHFEIWKGSTIQNPSYWVAKK